MSLSTSKIIVVILQIYSSICKCVIHVVIVSQRRQARLVRNKRLSYQQMATDHSKKITECFVAHEKYNSDSPCAKVLTKAVGYFIAKDLMPTNVVQ